MEVRAIRNKAAGRVEEPGVESPVDGRVRAIRDKAGEAVEVDKVEEPGVDAKALEVSC